MTGWTDIITGIRVVSNTFTSDDIGANLSRYNTTFGSDQEVWATITTKGIDLYAGVAIRMQAADGKGYIGIVRSVAGTDDWSIYRVDDPGALTFTLLGSNVIGPEFADGDKIGMDAIGTTIRLFHFASSWAEITSVTDSTYSGAHIGLYINDITQAMDDFGGGAVVTTTTPQLRTIRSNLRTA
jgi:hypothetical protein